PASLVFVSSLNAAQLATAFCREKGGKKLGGRRCLLVLARLIRLRLPQLSLRLVPPLRRLRSSTNFAMEMRACESINMAEDLTGAIAPYATALHDSFLHSHCSSCFHKLPPQSSCITSCVTCCSVRYCCSDCLSSDSPVHVSSGECCFFVNHLNGASPSCVAEGTSDFRAALRLLYVLEARGLVSSDSIDHSSRIGGLSTSGIEQALEEGDEIAKRILEGSLLMSSARKSRTQASVGLSDGLETLTLWAVITNSVEVQVSEDQAIGIAVYSPSFSWFNHSCFPNASYRFALAPWHDDCTSHKSKSCLVPASRGVAQNALHAQQYEEDCSTHELCKYGPRIVVRCTKPIMKGDEVCISYIDLLQTREARHSDLWLKYKFVCSCKRCTASPESYTDLILNCDARDLRKPDVAATELAVEELNDALQLAISEYTSGDDAKACCDMIESILSKNMMSDLQHEELSRRIFILHPLHYICLSSYMTLASAYRFRVLSLEPGSLHGEKNDDRFRMVKAAAAYSLMLVGTTHRFFVSECSFMIPLSHFLLSAGQAMLFLVESIKGDTNKNVIEGKFTLPPIPASSIKHDSLQYHEFKSTCEAFGKQMLFLSLHSWPFLVQSLPCLQKIKNPIEFSWLGATIFESLHLSEEDYADICAHDPAAFKKGQKNCIFRLAICCITYCKYLASICYGPQHYLTNHAKDLLEVIFSQLEMADEYDRSSYKTSGGIHDEGGYNKTSTDDYGRGTGGFNKSSTDDYGSGAGYKKSSTDEYGSGGVYNKSNTDDYGSGAGYKSSTDEYGSGGAYNKSNTDDYGTGGAYNKSSTDNYGSSGAYNKSNTDDYSSGGANKSNTNDYSSGGANKSNTDDYGSGGAYNKSSTDDYCSGGDYKKSSTDEYGSGGDYKKSSTDEYGSGGTYNKSSTDNYGSGGANKSSTDNYGSGGDYKKSSTDEYGSGGTYNKSGTGNLSSDAYNKSSTDDYSGTSGYNKSSTDDYSGTGGYKKSSTDDYSGTDGNNKSSTDDYNTGSKDSNTSDYGRGDQYKKTGSDNYGGDYKSSGNEAVATRSPTRTATTVGTRSPALTTTVVATISPAPTSTPPGQAGTTPTATRKRRSVCNMWFNVHVVNVDMDYSILSSDL
ncbi:hypothetical protein EJB05_38002, partial [Eragrostis curvula]